MLRFQRVEGAGRAVSAFRSGGPAVPRDKRAARWRRTETAKPVPLTRCWSMPLAVAAFKAFDAPKSSACLNPLGRVNGRSPRHAR